MRENEVAEHEAEHEDRLRYPQHPLVPTHRVPLKINAHVKFISFICFNWKKKLTKHAFGHTANFGHVSQFYYPDKMC